MANLFDGPPALAGDGQQQMIQMYRYLQGMSEQLNEALNSITLQNFTPEARQQIEIVTKGGETEKQIAGTKNALRSLIIKSAEIVRTEMDELRTELSTQYQGVSELYGQMDRKLSDEITASAEGIRQNFEYYEQLQGWADGTQTYVTHQSNYIFTGLIDYDSVTGDPVYGMAIGEGITQYDQDNNPYINVDAKVATFTKEKLSFWHGNTEVAYFSDNRMYIIEAEVLKRLKMGSYVWRVLSDGSMGLRVET